VDKTAKRKILWLRISYRVGAIIDAVYIIPMIFPQLGGSYFGIIDFNPGGEYRYAMAVAAALMLGWTILLIWADRKPVERRGVVLMTIIPVKVCLDLASIYLLVYNFMPLEKILLYKIDSILLYALFIFSYINSRGLVVKQPDSAIGREAA